MRGGTGQGKGPSGVGQSKDARKRCGEVISGSRCKGFELEVPKLSVTRMKTKSMESL